MCVRITNEYLIFLIDILNKRMEKSYPLTKSLQEDKRMSKLDPIVLISLQSAGFSEKQLVNVFEVDEKTVNDYLDCYNTGFDCALLYIGNRLEKAGVSMELIDAILGVPMYAEIRDPILALPALHLGKEIVLERLKENLTPEQIEMLKKLKAQ